MQRFPQNQASRLVHQHHCSPPYQLLEPLATEWPRAHWDRSWRTQPRRIIANADASCRASGGVCPASPGCPVKRRGQGPHTGRSGKYSPPRSRLILPLSRTHTSLSCFSKTSEVSNDIGTKKAHLQVFQNNGISTPALNSRTKYTLAAAAAQRSELYEWETLCYKLIHTYK